MPIQYYDYSQNVDRWSNEVRLQSKEGGQFHWLAGLYYEKSRGLISNFYHMPGMVISCFLASLLLIVISGWFVFSEARAVW